MSWAYQAHRWACIYVIDTQIQTCGYKRDVITDNALCANFPTGMLDRH